MVHCLVNTGDAACGAGRIGTWPAGDRGVSNAARLNGHGEEVTCPNCVKILGTVLTASLTLDRAGIEAYADELEAEGLFDEQS